MDRRTLIKALMGGLVLLATCIPLHYDDVERQSRMLTKVMDEIQ